MSHVGRLDLTSSCNTRVQSCLHAGPGGDNDDSSPWHPYDRPGFSFCILISPPPPTTAKKFQEKSTGASVAAQQTKWSPVIVASCVREPVPVQVVPFPNKFPVNTFKKGKEDGPYFWDPTAHVGDPDVVLGS